MKVEKKKLTSFLKGDLPVERLELISTISPRRTLLVLEPRSVPGLGAVLTLSHPCERVRWWLYAKLLSETLSEHEELVLTLLLLSRSDEEWNFFSEVKTFDFSLKDISVRIALSQKLNALFAFTRGNPTEFWRTFNPSLTVNRFWVDRKKLPEVARIGVGYKDRGSLRTGSCEPVPSDDSSEHSRWSEMFFSFRLLVGEKLPTVLGQPGWRFSPPRRRQAEELQRAKR